MRRPILAAAAALLAAAGATALLAQSPDLVDQRARLAIANRAAQAADARAQALQRAAAAERDEARRAGTREAAVAASIQAAEAQIAAARARIAIVDRMLAQQRVRLAEQQGPIARLVAALQSLARRPALLGLVQPGSTSDIVHVRAALGAVAPVVRARADGVRGEIDRTRRLREGAQLAEQSLRDARTRLEDERLALVKLEAEHRLRSADYRRTAMVESDRALALGEQARDLVDLMDSLGQAAQTRAALEALPGPLPRPGGEDEAAAAAPRRSAQPPYRLPVAGQIVTGLGEVSAEGVRSRGLTLATWPGAQVVAPTGGRVVYAGRFRRYGNIVILDHGGGWTSLVTGLDRLAVRVGDVLIQGSPLGRAPQAAESPRIAVELRRQGRPVDLAQLLD
ncbi:murein hydrolase activator EnvC family protein [Sphingomonas turrisvirgatae]|uniref:Metalloendopeptidase n=1 Tax=Sphingomonas turrisvirgatae TaxID=1888892 RepID=A0A1E3LWK1_9SPHN|nr:peptidoglycan DD-metalloendopeptidase family protein [Sphingomonas turrisvirgatae]ODP38167.1 metalloendopeptidase [Sphingomonas turrisvirgatae]